MFWPCLFYLSEIDEKPRGDFFFSVVCHDCALASSFVPAGGRMAALKSVRAGGLRAGRELEKSPADALYRSRPKTSKRWEFETDQAHQQNILSTQLGTAD